MMMMMMMMMVVMMKNGVNDDVFPPCTTGLHVVV
jgi:hypothetical protein